MTGKVIEAMKRTAPKGAADPGFVPIAWDEALDLIAARMRRVADEDGPAATAFAITTGSGTQISDGLPFIERLARAYGSPNTIYSAEICNWHKDFASRFTFGADLGVPGLVMVAPSPYHEPGALLRHAVLHDPRPTLFIEKISRKGRPSLRPRNHQRIAASTEKLRPDG